MTRCGNWQKGVLPNVCVKEFFEKKVTARAKASVRISFDFPAELCLSKPVLTAHP